MGFMVSSPGKQETHCCLPLRYFYNVHILSGIDFLCLCVTIVSCLA